MQNPKHIIAFNSPIETKKVVFMSVQWDLSLLGRNKMAILSKALLP